MVNIDQSSKTSFTKFLLNPVRWIVPCAFSIFIFLSSIISCAWTIFTVQISWILAVSKRQRSFYSAYEHEPSFLCRSADSKVLYHTAHAHYQSFLYLDRLKVASSKRTKSWLQLRGMTVLLPGVSRNSLMPKIFFY